MLRQIIFSATNILGDKQTDMAVVLRAHPVHGLIVSVCLNFSSEHELLTSLRINICVKKQCCFVYILHSREDNEFADVTLSCEDNKQNEAHRVMLSITSDFFRNLIVTNNHPHDKDIIW